MTAATNPESATLRERGARARLQALPGREWAVPVATLGCGIALFLGYRIREEQFLRPDEGLGYWLGIAGATLMVLLLGYALRKRWSLLKGAGALRHWFRIHMVLGVLAPTAILFHANFSLGSVNSTVALAALLIVAGSGYIGRFAYARVHRGLFGQKRELAEILREAEEGFGAIEALLRLAPERAADAEALDAVIHARGGGLLAAIGRNRRAARLARRLQRAGRRALEDASEVEKDLIGPPLWEHLHLARLVTQFRIWERVFALWHAVHVPLALLLFVAAAVHILAVHMY